jgi:hypothetical protein
MADLTFWQKLRERMAFLKGKSEARQEMLDLMDSWGPHRFMFIEGTKLGWETDEQTRPENLLPGAVWVQNKQLHYVDQEGDERTVEGIACLEQ